MKYLVFLFGLFAAASAFSQEVINYDQASLHLDSYVTVCGKVAQVVNKGDHSLSILALPTLIRSLFYTLPGTNMVICPISPGKMYVPREL